MSFSVEWTCDDCGISDRGYALFPLADWEETDDGEDLCPECAIVRSEGAAADAPAP